LVCAHGDAIEEARRPEGEALLAAFAAKLKEDADRADELVAFAQRSFELAHIRRQDTRQIPIDGVANAARMLRQLAESPPALPIRPKELS